MNEYKIKNRFELVKKSKTFKRIIRKFDLKNKKVLDLGCGYGEYMIHFGKGSMGITTSRNEVEYGEKNNLNIIYGNVELLDELKINESFDVFWANNFFEYILSSHSFLLKLKTISKKDSILILGVPVLPKFLSLLKIAKFRGALASNHINFFTKKSLILTVQRAGWHVKEVRSFLFGNFVIDKIFNIISPHLYVIAKNINDFKYPTKKILEWENDPYYKDLLKITNQNKF